MKKHRIPSAARRLARAGGTPSLAQAVTLRVANQGDVQSMDPHSLNESLQLSFTGNVYESLIERDKTWAWRRHWRPNGRRQSPTVWRFDLRPNVKFHDGTPFTADDVVFTFKRAAGEGSDMKGYTNPIKEVRKVGDLRRRHRDHGAVSDPSRHAHDARDHEQEMVRGEQGRASGRSPQGHREHRELQGQRHRPVPAARSASRRCAPCWSRTSTGGARSTATSTRSSSRRSATTRRASPRCSPARPT